MIVGREFRKFIYGIYHMVTVLTIWNLKFKINPRDHSPPHVHVEGGGASVRINLLTLQVMDDRTDFSQRLVHKILEHVEANREQFIEVWMVYHEK